MSPNQYIADAYIALTQGQTAIIDSEDTALVSTYKWQARRDSKRPEHWYAITTIRDGERRRKTLLLHRLLLNTPPGTQVDHKDGDGLNNRRSNLRIATNAQNCMNQPPPSNNTSGYKGVSYHKARRKWQAKIRVNRKDLYLGLFIDPKDAALAYDAKAKEVFGEFAWLNFNSN